MYHTGDYDGEIEEIERMRLVKDRTAKNYQQYVKDFKKREEEMRKNNTKLD